MILSKVDWFDASILVLERRLIFGPGGGCKENRRWHQCYQCTFKEPNPLQNEQAVKHAV